MTTAGDFIRQYAWRLCYGFALLTVLEFLFPTVRGSLIQRGRALSFWVAYLVITTVGMTIFITAFSRAGWHPLITLDFIGAPLLGILIGDFFYYWFHRLQHRVPWLWRLHAEHHSFRDMNAINSPHHFTEEIVRVPLVLLPTWLLVRTDGAVPALLMTVLAIQGYFIHSSTRLNLGPFRWVIADNRFHRVHHSLDPVHFDTNFASVAPIWDVLFGTAFVPPQGAMLSTGLADLPQPITMRDYLFRPFRRAVQPSLPPPAPTHGGE